MSKIRKRYTKAEKLEIVKQSLDEDVQVTDLADRYGLSPNTIYNWRSKYYKEQGLKASGQASKR
jgi:transposase